mgnify:CR=1 FL=1
MVDEMRGGAVDGIVGEFATYEDYLDSQISPTDLYYLEDEDLARRLLAKVNDFNLRSAKVVVPLVLCAPREDRVVRLCVPAELPAWSLASAAAGLARRRPRRRLEAVLGLQAMVERPNGNQEGVMSCLFKLLLLVRHQSE